MAAYIFLYVCAIVVAIIAMTLFLLPVYAFFKRGKK